MMTSAQHARLNTIRSIDRTKLVAERSRFNPDFATIGKGAVIALDGQTYMVAGTARYSELSWDWRREEGNIVRELELFSLETGATAYLEWEHDDTVVCYLSLQKHDSDPGRHGVGNWNTFLTDDRLDSSLTITVGSVTYRYNDDESWAARFERDGDDKKMFVRCYEFERGDDCLTIEVWGKKGDEGVELWTSREVNPRAVQLLARGAA